MVRFTTVGPRSIEYKFTCAHWHKQLTNCVCVGEVLNNMDDFN